jgi:hypothetical protein
VDPVRPEDPFVRAFLWTAVHVRRFLPFYGGGLAWLAMMVLVQPFDAGGGNGGELASGSGAAVGAASVPSASASAPALPAASVEAVPLDASALGFLADDAPFDVGPSFASPSPSSDVAVSTATATASTTSRAPRPLVVTRSGYSSRTGGTPFEQPPPGNGLPVAASGGEAVKRSFVAVDGDQPVLRLKLVDDPSARVGAEPPAVMACAIRATGWKAERGSSFDAEPAWDVPCVGAVVQADGSWAWDLSLFGDVGSLPGLALTVDPGHVGATFSVVFDPVAVPNGT